MLAEAGLSENPFSFAPIIGFLFAFALMGILSYLLLQRAAELMIGRTTTSIREILFYTAVIALLCALLILMERRRSPSDSGRNSSMPGTTPAGSA